MDTSSIDNGQSALSVEDQRFATQHNCSANRSVSIPTSEHSIDGKWNLYYHLPHDKSWELSSYTIIMGSIDTVEKVIALNESIHENVVKNC